MSGGDARAADVPERRPAALYASLVLFGAGWLFTLALALAGGELLLPAAAGAVWGPVLALVLYRAWLGGPFALAVIAQVGAGFGVLSILSVLLVLLIYPDDVGATLRVGLPALGWGAVMIVAGLLVRHRSVRAWRPGPRRARRSG